MTEAATAGGSKVRNVILWLLQIAGAAVFSLEGVAKVVGNYDMVDSFATLGYGQWVRYVVGGFEILGAMLLLLPMGAEAGSWLLMLLMIGAVFANVVFLHVSPVLPLVLLIFMIIIAVGRHQHRRHRARHDAAHAHGAMHTHDSSHHSHEVRHG